MADKLDALSLKAELILVPCHICDQHRVVLLGSLDRRVGWSTMKTVSIPWSFCVFKSFINSHNSPSEYHWGEWWYQIFSAVGDVGLNMFTQ